MRTLGAARDLTFFTFASFFHYLLYYFLLFPFFFHFGYKHGATWICMIDDTP